MKNDELVFSKKIEAENVAKNDINEINLYFSYLGFLDSVLIKKENLERITLQYSFAENQRKLAEKEYIYHIQKRKVLIKKIIKLINISNLNEIIEEIPFINNINVLTNENSKILRSYIEGYSTAEIAISSDYDLKLINDKYEYYLENLDEYISKKTRKKSKTKVL